MSKRSKVRSKKKRLAKKTRRSRVAAQGKPPRRLLGTLRDVHDLMDKGRLDEARKLLEREDRRRRGYPDLLKSLLEVYQQLGDFAEFACTARRLAKLTPNDRHAWLMLGDGYMRTVHPMLALDAFRHFLERWPDDPMADSLCDTIQRLEAVVADIMSQMRLTSDEFDLAVLHDEILFYTSMGEFADVAVLARQFLERKPEFPAARNNLCEALFHLGRMDEAIEICSQTLSDHPDNGFALGILTKLLFFSGRMDEAKTLAHRIRNQPVFGDYAAKQAEALSLLGDDDGVLDLFDQAKDGDFDPPSAAMLYHLAAVAQMRQGNEAEARRCWKHSLSVYPGFNLAKSNLEELDGRAECHAPWPFTLNYWIPRPLFDRLVGQLDVARRGQSDGRVKQQVQQLLEHHPDLAQLLPALLDRGDMRGREFAFRLATMLRSPELLSALREFAFSQRGPDELRNQACTVLREEGLLQAGPHRLFINGDWQEIELWSVEVTPEPTTFHRPEAFEIASEAREAMRNGEDQRAEELWRKCVEIDPDDPSLLNNLAGALQHQGRVDEALKLLREIHERFPDYLFARTSLARLAVGVGDFERAKDLLHPLRARKKMHTSEAVAYATATIELALAQEQFESAEATLGMLETIDPENPGIERLRQRIELAKRRKAGPREFSSAAADLFSKADGPAKFRLRSSKPLRPS